MSDKEDRKAIGTPNSDEEEQQHLELPKEMHDAMEQIVKYKNACIRECTTLLAGFKATKERDIDYMDGYMDRLYDIMDQGSDVEFLYRKYIVFIASFNPQEGKKRFLSLEEDLGYWAPAVYAAAHVAKKLHQGQKDKGGNDYFTSHLLKVGNACHTWKQQIVGFLHEAEEDTGNDVETVLSMVEKQLHEWGEHIKDRPWEDEVEEFDIMPYPGNSIFYPSDDDWKEIADALLVLNHHTAPNREAYINRFRSNILALHVKLNDMRNNMDISRIPNPTAEDYARLERYKKEYEILIQMLRDYYGPNR